MTGAGNVCAFGAVMLAMVTAKEASTRPATQARHGYAGVSWLWHGGLGLVKMLATTGPPEARWQQFSVSTLVAVS